MNNCEYCNISFENQRIILENEHCFYLQLLNTDIEGSGIIIPKKHRETVFDLTDEEWFSTYELLKKAKKEIDKIHKPDGYNVGWNCGSVGGQHIFHSHLHVIPRYKDETYAGKGIRNWIKSPDNNRVGKRR